MKMGVSQNSTFVTALLAGQRQWIMAHLYQFVSASGDNDYFTDMDADINIAGTIYKSGGLRIQGLKMKVAIGVSVDEQECVIWASPTDTLFGATFLSGMAEGLMDGGQIIRSVAVWTPVTGDPYLDTVAPPIASWVLFTGYMSTIEKIGRASVTFKVKSPLVKLNMNMPRRFYQPTCNWSLFDAGCTLLASAFAVSGTIGSGPNLTTIPVSGGIATPNGADGVPNYQRGRIFFNSGDNEGLLATVDTNDADNLYLAYPLNTVPNAGDSITFYPGCSKTFATCQSKFNNTQNFDGFDLVPNVFVSV